MEDILARLLVADNAVIQKATQDLKEAFKRDDTVPQLCSIFVKSQNPQIRQYAAVILRQRFSRAKHWDKLNLNDRKSIKEGILNAIVHEPENFVKKAIGQLIGAIIRHEIPRNTWPELLEFIIKICNHEDVQQRTFGMFILSILTDMSPNLFSSHSQFVAALIVNSLNNAPNDADMLISYTIDTMKSLVPISEDDQNLKNMYTMLLPRILQAIKVSANTDEVKTSELIDMLEDLMEVSVITTMNHYKLLINLSIELIQDQALREPVRGKALSMLDCAVKIKKKAIVKNNLLLPIMDVILQVMRTPNLDDETLSYEQESEDPDSCVACAARVLDSLALNLPPEKLMPPLLERIQVYLEGQDPYGRKASYMAMAVIVEGCAEYVTNRYLAVFMDLVCRGLREPTPIVRNSALFALGQFSEHLQPEISKHAEQLMPILFEFLEQLTFILKEGKSEPSNVNRMFYALETFIENSDKKTFLPYLPLLMERLLSLLSLTSSDHFKQLVLSSLGACATASEDDIYPFFHQLVDCISQFLKQQASEDTVGLQTVAIDTLSTLARAVTPEHFRPISQESVQLGLKLLESQTDPDLRGSAYGLFGAISAVLKDEMGPIMTPVVESMMQSVTSSEGFVVHYKDQGVGYPTYEDSSNSEDEEDIEFSEDDDDKDDDVAGFTVENSYTEEKVSACIALREIAANTGPAFNPYLESCFEAVFKLIGFPQDDVRKVATNTLAQLCINFSKIGTEEGKSALMKALTVFIPKCSEIIHTDQERDVVAQALEAYSSMLKHIKAPVIEQEGHREAVINCVKDVFAKQTACQDRDDDSSNDEEEAEHDEMLIEYAGDVLPGFGKALSADEFVPYFIITMPYLTSKLKRQCTVAQRSFAVGILAECMEPLGPRLNQFAHQVLPLFTTFCKDEHQDIRNNAVFGLGEMLYHGKEPFFNHYTDVLRLLSECIAQEQDPSVIDNICGALSRMILTNINLVPLPQVFPFIMKCIPLKKDFNENSLVFKCLIHLYEGGHELILLNLDYVLNSALTVIHHKQGEEDALMMAEHLFISAKHDFPERVANLRPSLPAEISPTYERLLAK